MVAVIVLALLALIGAIRVLRITVQTARATGRAIGDSYRAIAEHARHERSKRVAPAGATTVDPALVAAVVAALRAAHNAPTSAP
jgi:hypothetical protein